MGALEDERDERCVLLADHLIGRAPESALRIDHPSVSWRHASLRWTGNYWALQDLGSLNGTFVDTVRVEPGSRVLLRVGARLRFGGLDGEWTLTEADAPETALLALDDGRRIAARDGLIVLPDADQPELSIYCQADGGWIAETAERAWALSPDEIVAAGGRQFRFVPGAAVYATSAQVRQPTPATIALEFVVSRNEEHVELTVVRDGKRLPLRPRAHTYLLLTLARERLREQAQSALDASGHGWIEQSRLVKMLATSNAQLALDIYRARRQLAEAGVADAAQLVERRPSSRELRIGVESLSVRVV